MRGTARASLLIALAVGAGGVAVSAAHAAGSPATPPTPSFAVTGERGAALVTVPVVGRDGRLVTDAKGHVTTVTLRLGAVPAPPR